jgi:hypothetical protein
MTTPRIELGSVPWQGTILPLDQVVRGPSSEPLKTLMFDVLASYLVGYIQILEKSYIKLFFAVASCNAYFNSSSMNTEFARKLLTYMEISSCGGIAYDS